MPPPSRAVQTTFNFNPPVFNEMAAPVEADPFAGREEDDKLQVTFQDGTVLVGSYLTRIYRHFLHLTGPGYPAIGKVVGPIDGATVKTITVIKSRAQIDEERYNQSRGERVPGREPVTREDFQYRLEHLASIAVREVDEDRSRQIGRQFDDVADRIALAKPKRVWMRAAARWYLTQNRPPEMADLWFEDIASPSWIVRPRPQDFDPDPVKRCKKVPVPAIIADDPLSVPNVLSRLRALGLNARISLAGDNPHERAEITVPFPMIKGRSKYTLEAKRHDTGAMIWRVIWAGNRSDAGRRRQRRVDHLDLYHQMIAVVRDGLVPSLDHQGFIYKGKEIVFYHSTKKRP